MRGKRGEIRRAVVRWVITLLVLFVFSAFAYTIYNKAPAEFDKSACKLSIAQRGSWLIDKLPREAKPPLQCKTQKIEIKTADENEIKRTFANAMFDCWDMMGQGKIDFLGQEISEILGTKDRDKATKSVCLICSTLTFDDKLKKKPKTITGFPKYLEETKIPGRELNYSQFLLDKEDAAIELLDPQYSRLISTGTDYAVVYMNIKGVKISEFYKNRKRIQGVVATWIHAGELCDGRSQGCAGLFLFSHDAEFYNFYCDDLKTIP